MVRNTAGGREVLRGALPVSGKPSSGACARGFTLIELLIVMTLIGILASIGIPTYNKSVVRAREAALRKDLYHMREAIDKYYGDNESYPEDLHVLVDKLYIRKVPEDPFTRGSDTWVEILSDDGTGIFDVVSGSEDLSRAGIPYSEW